MSASSDCGFASILLCQQGDEQRDTSWWNTAAEKCWSNNSVLLCVTTGGRCCIRKHWTFNFTDKWKEYSACEHVSVHACQWACAYTSVCNNRTFAVMFIWPVTSYPKLSVYNGAICFNLLQLTVIFPFKWNWCTTTGLPVTWKWKILPVMAVGLHIRGQTVLLTFPIGVFFIALPFQGKLYRSLCHIVGQEKKKKRWIQITIIVSMTTSMLTPGGLLFVWVLINKRWKKQHVGAEWKWIKWH